MDHITTVLIRLHWLPVEYRSHGLIPVYLTELVKPYVPLRSQSAYHFSKYLPPDQRHSMVTAVSTRLRPHCGRTYHSSSKLWTRYQLLNRI